MKKWLKIFGGLYAEGTGWKWILGICGVAYIFNMDGAPDIGKWTMMMGGLVAILLTVYTLHIVIATSIVMFKVSRHQKEQLTSPNNARDAKQLIHICTVGVGACVATVLILTGTNTVAGIALGFAAFFFTRIMLRLAGRL